MKWRTIFNREMRQIFIQDPRLAGIIFAASIAYLVIFSLLYGTHVVTNVPLVICDEDQSQLSRSLVQAFADSEKFQIITQTTSEEDMKQLLREHTAYAAVHVQQGFARNVTGGRSSTVLFLASGLNLVVTNIATAAAQEIISVFGQNASVKLAETAGLPPTLAANKTSPTYVVLRVLNNPTLSYLNFFVIGLAMAAFQQGIFLPVGASMIGEYHKLHELAEIPPLKVITGKLLPYLLLDTLSFFLTLVVSIKVFAIPFKGDLASLFILSTAFITTAIGFSSLAASFCDSEITFTKLCLIYSVPAFTLSGYIWPLVSMDAFSQMIAYTFPLFYFADTLRDIMLSGYSPLFMRNVLVLFLMGISLIGLSTMVYAHRRKPLRLAGQQSDITAS